MRLTLDLGAIQKEIDALSKQFRELDTRIQGVNWTRRTAGTETRDGSPGRLGAGMDRIVPIHQTLAAAEQPCGSIPR